MEEGYREWGEVAVDGDEDEEEDDGEGEDEDEKEEGDVELGVSFGGMSIL